MTLSIGLDIGGTNIKTVVIDQTGHCLHQSTRSTGQHYQAEDEWVWKNAVRDVFHELKKEFGGQKLAVGISAPGLANANNSAITCMPGRLFGLEGFDWSSFFGERVWVLNDGHAALVSEARFGAAKGYQHAVLLTLGTGVGGGILIGGELYQGHYQLAGHVAHTTVNANDVHRDATGMPGAIEEHIGNESVGRRSHGRFQNTYELVAAYQRGDHFGTWLWLDSVQKLAVSICSLTNLLSPEVVVLGGGITKAGEALFQPLQSFVDLYEWRPGGKQVPIVLAKFGEFAGAMGAAAFAQQRVRG
ncbi:MAG: ROK family protein [Saprospiraceae bacterium]|nr:ROK family protein [Saprospiraceae bacterium]MCF8250725.1 ROK family protein [Saprospiraceae bacterium]MCF8279782.1 ROK family protein [Bacteroidales bacterium]MCF8310513.1 ROK family protein [Saprospiraceae bacterium]MCF8440855.1 ROK family protein [Saprospiraceae bacterium]